MDRTMDILATIFPIFLTIGLGMLCRKKQLLTRDGIDAIKKVAVNLTLPAVSLAAFAQAEYTPKTILITVWIFACCCCALALGFGAQRMMKIPGKLSPYLCTGFEGGMLGFALYPMLYGTLAPFAIVDMGQVFFVFTIYKMLISGARSPRALLKEAATSPPLWALLLGILIGATGLYGAMALSGMQAIFDQALSFISAPTSFLILLTVGYDLRPAEIMWKKATTVVITRLVIMGLLLGATFLFDRWILGNILEPAAVVLLFALPAPFVLPVFANDPDERGFLSSTLSLMTCITVLIFAVIVFVFK